MFHAPQLNSCTLCPRACGAARNKGTIGFCGAGKSLRLARAELHFWEEPPLSGASGSGCIFFSGCPLRCCYCQNASIALAQSGIEVSTDRLSAIFHELEQKGALNINCVTGTPYIPHVVYALNCAREKGFSLPVVWNTSSYETIDSLDMLAGSVDVFLADFKYAQEELARNYSRAAAYPRIALRAIKRMAAQVGEMTYDTYHQQTRMTKGVIVRHLLLPGHLDDSCKAVRLLWDTFGNSIAYSFMNQYTSVLKSSAEHHNVRACAVLQKYPELAQHVPAADYERLLNFADDLGIEDYFWQEGDPVSESFIPAFDGTGVLSAEQARDSERA